MKLLYILFSLIFFLCSCSSQENDSEDSTQVSEAIDTKTIIHLLDNNKLDLLNPENEYSYNWDEIKIFSDSELSNDISENFKDSNSGNLIHKGLNYYYIKIYSDFGITIEETNDVVESTLYLQLSENEIDTIKVETTLNPYTYISKFTYNKNSFFETPEERKDWDNIITK